MKKLIIITGITATGKTTTATKYGKFRKCKVIHYDDLYTDLNNHYGIHNNANKNLIKPVNWNDYLDFKEQKYKIFKERYVFNDDTIVLEGDMNSLEMAFIKEHYPDYHFVIVFLVPSTDIYINNLKQKYKIENQDLYSWQNNYDRKQRQSYNDLTKSGYQYIHVINNYDELFTDFQDYQRDDYCNLKFKYLGFPKDMTGMKILDIGCNQGFYLKKCYDAGSRNIHGIDFCWSYLQDSLDKFKEINDLKPVLWRRNANKEKWAEGTYYQYDLIYCLATIHYIDDYNKFLAEISLRTKAFIVDMPILEDNIGEKWEVWQHIKRPIPNENAMVSTLKKHFKDVKVYGKSVAPNLKDYRLVFHCNN